MQNNDIVGAFPVTVNDTVNGGFDGENNDALTLQTADYSLTDAMAADTRRMERSAAQERMGKLRDYALLGHNAEWDDQHAELKKDTAFSHLAMEDMSQDDRDFLLGLDIADTLAKGDTWGAAQRLAETLSAEKKDAYLQELNGCEKEADMFRLMGRSFREQSRSDFDRQQEWAKQQEAVATRWAAGDDYDESFTEDAVDAMIEPMADSDYENMTRVREFMRDYIRPLEKIEDFEEAMRRLDGMENEMLKLVGDDEGSKARADMVAQTLLSWAQKMSRTNRANEWNEVEVAVGKTLSNWMRFQEQSVLQQLRVGNYMAVGVPSMPVVVEVGEETRRWAAERNAERLQRDKARGTLRLAVDEAMKADESLHWTRKMTRGAASMFGETAPYLLPNGMLLGSTNLMTGGAYEQYTKNLAQGMEAGEAFVNAYEMQGLNATVEALPWNRAISRIGGTGLNATFGRFLSEDIKRGIKPGWLTRKVASWSSKGVWRAAAAETVGSFVDEAVLEPIAQGFLQYGTDNALDLLGVKHGETKEFFDDFDELTAIWTDPTQMGALLLFSAALTGAYTPQIKKQVEVFAKNRNFWLTQGLTENQADDVVASENPWEEGRKAVNEAWESDPEAMRQRRLDNNRALAAQGGVLVLTGAGSSDPDLNPGGMVDEAARAVWQDYVERGILPQVERADAGHVRITRKDGKSLVLTDEQADIYLLDALQHASAEETRKLQELMGRKEVSVNLREAIAQHISSIAGRAVMREVKNTSDRTGLDYEDVLEFLPNEIKAKIEAAGAITYEIAEDISRYAMGQIDEMVAGGATEQEARNTFGVMGRMRSLGTWADFARDFAKRAAAGNIDLMSARTTINRSRGKRRLRDGKWVLEQALIGVGGKENHFGGLEDVTESFADQMLDERTRALQEENKGLSDADAYEQALKELHGIVKEARDEVVKADPKVRIENMGETPDYTEVVEALSTMALSQFATGNAVPQWMRGLSHALAANLQMAADVNMVRAAYANALKTAPDALAKMEQLMDKLGVQVRDVMREAQITQQDIAAWKNSVGVAAARAESQLGSGGAAVSDVVDAAEREERDIAAHEKEKPVQEAEPTTAAELNEGFERAADPLPEETVPERMRGVFTGGCVFNAAGGFFVGLVDKTKLRDGTEQVKKGVKGKHGVIAGRELTGDFQASAAPLYVWKRKNGELQVISGRHRFELMLRDDSVESHLCYVFEEDAEHDEKWARMLDYENNMRDDQADELTAATYVRETGYSDEVLRQKGLLRNASRSKRGALIGREARQELWDRFNNGAIEAKDAEIICNLTKNIRDAARIEDIQARCCLLLAEGKSWDYIGAMTQLMANKEAVVMRQGLLDLGADFEADLNRAATWIEKNLAKINEAITLLKQGRKMGEKKRKEAERLGISVATAEGTAEMLQLLNDLKAKFEFIGSYPDMVAAATLYDGVSEVDPVGQLQLLEKAQQDRAEMAAENAMSDDELLEKRNRELAAQSVPTLFEMQGERSDAEISPLPGENEESYAERVSIMNRAKADGTWLKAPNGEPSKLNPQQWTQVRTKAFKKWFGDWESAAELSFDSIEISNEECQNALKKESGKPFINEETAIEAAINSRQRNKITSGKAQRKSVEAGFTTGVHNYIASNIRTLFKHATKIGDYRDRIDDPNIISVKRFVCPVRIAGIEAFAYMTVKESKEHGHHIYSLELDEIKKLEGNLDEHLKEMLNPTPSGDIVAKVQELSKSFFESVSKVVDENGEPRVVYHGTATDGLSVFDHKKAQDKTGRRYAMGWGKGKFYLTTSEMGALNAASGAAARGEGSTPQAMPLFVSMRNPITADEYNARYKALSGHELNEPYADGYGMKERDRFIKALDKSLSKEKIDGIVDDGSGALAVFKPNQMKSATQNNGGFSRENDNITFSMESEIAALKDAAIADGTFMTAPNGKPTKLTERQWLQVRTKAFKKWFGDWENDPENASKVLDENGEPRVFYHGSWWNTLAEKPGERVFDINFLGSASGDNGYFGNGFYFAFDAREAEYYGGIVNDYFLNMRNPLYVQEDLETIDGYRPPYASDFALILNLSRRFPDLVKDKRLYYYDRENVRQEVSYADFLKDAADVLENVEFITEETEDSFGKEYVVKAGPVEMRDGDETWTEYRFEMRMLDDGMLKDKYAMAVEYLRQTKYNGMVLPSISSFGVTKEFTDAVKEAGYDGVLQSASGDEAVAFHPNQIKSATDNRGTFDGGNPDVTFSMESEIAALKDAAIADGTFMTAPNGKPTKLTERQWLQVRTKAFKKWFGDWEKDPENASQVMDENGEPLVVYHGTPSYGFTVFDESRQGERDAGDFGKGFYFTPNKNYAATYALPGMWNFEGDMTKVYAVFINLRNPIFQNARNGAPSRYEMENHDGVIVGNDKYYELPYYHPKNFSEIVAFHPNQVKSATQNNGGFSRENDDITFSMERNLAAAHTLSVDKFLAVAKMGGIPVPSIAITRLDKPYSWGGSDAITLIGVSRLGQPGPGNRVYFHDAYTGTMPTTYNKKRNEKKLAKLLNEKIKPAVQPYGMENTTDLRNSLFRNSNGENVINRHDTKIRRNSALRAYWAITEKGYTPKPKMREARSPFIEYTWERYDAATKRKLRLWHKKTGDALTDEDIRKLCAIIREWYEANPLPLAGRQKIALETFADAAQYLGLPERRETVKNANYFKDGLALINENKREPDTYENYKMFDAYVKKHEAEFNAWADKFKADYVGNPMFKTRKQERNWRGEITDEWWEMVPATLTNLTRHMKAEKGRGNETGALSPGMFLALMSDEMKGKRDVSWKRDRLISSAEYKAIDEEYKEKYASFVQNVYDARKEGTYGSFDEDANIALYNVAELKEQGKVLNEANIEAALQKSRAVDWTPELLAQGVELVQMTQEMPSDYMEAIPMRAVKLDEFRYAIMPESLRDNAEVNAVLAGSLMEPIYHDGTREGYEKAMAGLIGDFVSFQMTEAALGALDILRGRENEVEGTRLINAWQEMVDAWTKGEGANKLQDGYRMMAEMRSLIAATRAVLPEKYARMGNLRLLLQWAEVYSTMADEGKVPMSGTIKNPIFEQVRQRWAEMEEFGRLEGYTEEELQDAFKDLGSLRLENAMRKVAEDSRRRLERWLKDLERKRIETLIEKAYPKREAGRKSPRGKMAAETYRYVEEAHELMDLDANKVADIIDANKSLLAALKPDDADYEQRQEKYENAIYMATLYGNWDGKSLDDARRAATELTQLITEGRRAWADKLQEERNHTRWLIKSITKNFKVKPEQAQSAGAKKQISEGSKKLTMLGKAAIGNMSLSHMLLLLRPVLGKEFCDRHRRMLAEHHKNTLRFNNELRAWMFNTLRGITGLQTEDELQVWMNDLNQEEHTGIRRQMPVRHGVSLTIEEARRWVDMSREERDAERKRIEAENEAKEQLDTNIPTEGHIEELRRALDRYDEGQRWAAMTEEERETAWQKASEGKSEEWKKENNPGTLMARARTQKFVKAETVSNVEQDEIVATKEGILYTLLLLDQDDYAHLKEPNGLTEENIAALREYLGPQVLAWGEAMRNKLIEQGNDMRAFYEAYTGVPLPSNPRYFPGAFKMEATKNTADAPDQQAGAGGGITGGKMGCLIARRKHNRQFDWLLSASSSFFSAMQQQFNYVSVTPMTREWKNLLNNAEFSRRLEAEVGPEVVNKLTSWVEMLDGAQLQDGRVAGLLARLLRPVLGFYAVSRLAGNVYTWVKQSSGIIHGYIGGYVPDRAVLDGRLNERMTYHHIGFGEYIGAFAKCLARQNTITLSEIKESDYIKQRANGDGRYLEEVLRMKPLTKVAGKAGRWAKRNITDRSMDVMEDIDRNANAVSMLALVNAVYDRAMAENADGLVPEAAIRAMAIETAGIMIDEVAQPKLRTQKSHWAASNALGGVAGDFIMLFKSESLNKLSVALAQGMSGEGAHALAGYAAFGAFNALVLWTINWVRGQWSFGDDDKSKTEWWQKLAKFGFNTITADLSALPIVGEAVGRLESKMFGGYSPQNSLLDSVVPFTGLVNSVTRETKAVDKGDAAWDKHLQNVTNIARDAAACAAYIPAVHGVGVTMSNLLAAAATVANISRTGKDVIKKTLELAE